jgi:hypothetical protein
LLKPLSFVRLRFGKIDFTPVAAIVLVVLLGEGLSFGVARAYQYVAGR